MKPSSFPWRIFTRIVLIQAVLVLLAVGGSGLASRYFFKKQFLAQVQTQLNDALNDLSRHVPSNAGGMTETAQGAQFALFNDDWCAAHAAQTSVRLSVISRDGRVLCDSESRTLAGIQLPARDEITAALREGMGMSVRTAEGSAVSDHEDFLYMALAPLDRNLVLLAAAPLTHLTHTLQVFDQSMALVLSLIAVLLSGFALWAGRTLVFPIGRILMRAQSVLTPGAPAAALGLPGAHLREDPYGEWSDLETSIEDIRKDLRSKIDTLTLEREEQATLMAAISDAILAVDVDEKPLFYNSRFAVLAGNEELKGSRHLWEFFRDPEILDGFRAALRNGVSGSVNAMPIENASGRRFYSVSISPLKRGPNQIYGAVGVFHDVTDLKRAEQIRIDFVANVSHELRTPLTAIKGYTDTILLDHKEGRPPEKEFVEIIARNSARLMNLINDLLDLSSIESTDVLHKSRLQTEEITRRVLGQVGPNFESKGQTVTLHVDAPTVHADPQRLEQVLVNLLDNAHKYTPAGGKISVQWADGPEQTVTLKVSDTGPGIPAEHQPRLFERFYRVDKSRSREQGGTGLGLAIVKHIMQRHHGEVWVESRPGQGTTFVCRFPSE